MNPISYKFLQKGLCLPLSISLNLFLLQTITVENELAIPEANPFSSTWYN